MFGRLSTGLPRSKSTPGLVESSGKVPLEKMTMPSLHHNTFPAGTARVGDSTRFPGVMPSRDNDDHLSRSTFLSYRQADDTDFPSVTTETLPPTRNDLSASGASRCSSRSSCCAVEHPSLAAESPLRQQSKSRSGGGGFASKDLPYTVAAAAAAAAAYPRTTLVNERNGSSFIRPESSRRASPFLSSRMTDSSDTTVTPKCHPASGFVSPLMPIKPGIPHPRNYPASQPIQTLPAPVPLYSNYAVNFPLPKSDYGGYGSRLSPRFCAPTPVQGYPAGLLPVLTPVDFRSFGQPQQPHPYAMQAGVSPGSIMLDGSPYGYGCQRRTTPATPSPVS